MPCQSVRCQSFDAEITLEFWALLVLLLTKRRGLPIGNLGKGSEARTVEVMIKCSVGRLDREFKGGF